MRTTHFLHRPGRAGTRRIGAAALLAMLLAASIAGCGGGGSDAGSAEPPPAAVSATIGAAGGSLVGPDGVQLDVPAGALAAPTTITITRDANGAPAQSLGDAPVYAITPHGLQFALPATLTLPPPALARTVADAKGEQIDLMRAQPGGGWEPLATEHADDGSARVLLGGLSYYASFGTGHDSAVGWVAPAPGTPLDAGGNAPRLITQATRVRVHWSAATMPWCGGSFEGGVSLAAYPVPFGGQVLQRQVQTFSVGGYARVSQDFELDVPVAAGPKQYYAITAIGRCLSPSKPPVGTAYELPPAQRQVYVVAQGIAAPTITRQPVGGVADPGDAVQLSIEASAPDTLVIDWQRSDDGGTGWVDIGSHAAQIAAVLGTGQTSTRFRAQVCNRSTVGSNCIFSDIATVTATATATPSAAWRADDLLAASGTHSMAISNAGVVWSWGADNGGALGRDTTASTPQPVALPGAARSVAAGGWYSVALLANGDVHAWGWGGNVGAAIGSTTDDNPLPVKVAGLQGIRAISTRYTHTLALDAGGAVWGFGPEDDGQLGPPVGHAGVRRIGGLADIRQIAAGERHSLALASDGTVWSWGANGLGQLGTPATPAAGRGDPQRVPGLTGVVAIAASAYGSFALAGDGTVWSWGSVASLGRDPAVASALAPAPVAGIAGAVRLDGGHQGGWATLADGRVFAWGGNGDGQTGVGSAGPVIAAPVAVPALNGVLRIAGGEIHSLALAADGSVLSWGANANLALDGNAGPARPTPSASGFDRGR